MAEHACNPSTQEVEARGPEVQGPPRPRSESEARLGYMRPCLRKYIKIKTMRLVHASTGQASASSAEGSRKDLKMPRGGFVGAWPLCQKSFCELCEEAMVLEPRGSWVQCGELESSSMYGPLPLSARVLTS